jgi:chemotaxis protein CheC
VRSEALTPLQLDALREVGGIGAGHAATALSQLTDRPISLAVPSIEVVELAAVPHVLGGAERLVGAVYSRMLGDITGGILFVAEREAVLALFDLMHGHELGTSRSIGRDEEVLLRHTATILISSYLAAIARLADLDVLPSDAAVAFDMAGALIEAVVAEVAAVAETAVLVRTSFIDESSTVEAGLFFVPNPESLEVLLGRLGVV